MANETTEKVEDEVSTTSEVVSDTSKVATTENSTETEKVSTVDEVKAPQQANLTKEQLCALKKATFKPYTFEDFSKEAKVVGVSFYTRKNPDDDQDAEFIHKITTSKFSATVGLNALDKDGVLAYACEDGRINFNGTEVASLHLTEKTDGLLKDENGNEYFYFAENIGHNSTALKLCGFVFFKKNAAGEDEVCHVINDKDFITIGNLHKIYSGKAYLRPDESTKANKDKDAAEVRDVIIDADINSGVIKYFVNTSTIGEDSVNKKDVSVLPIFVEKDFYNGLKDEIVEIFNKKDDIFKEFVSFKYDGSDVSDEDKTKFSAAVRTEFDNQVFNNKNLNKPRFVKEYVRKSHPCIVIKYPSDSDEINQKIVERLFPRYGSEFIDWTKITVDEDGIPVISKEDENNFAYSIDKNALKEFLNTSKTTWDLAKSTITEDNVLLESSKEDTLNAICNLSAVIEGTDVGVLFDSIVKNYEDINMKRALELNIQDSQDHIDNFKTTYATIQLTSKIIQKRIDSGEFENMFMNASTMYMFSMFVRLGVYNTEFDNMGVATLFYKSIVSIINTKINSGDPNAFSGIVDRSIRHITPKPNQFGASDQTLTKLFEDNIYNLISTDAEEGVSEEDRTIKAQKQLENAFKYITSVSKAPFKVVTELYPELLETITGITPDIDKINECKKYYEEYGFKEIKDANEDNIDTLKASIAKIKDDIKASLNTISTYFDKIVIPSYESCINDGINISTKNFTKTVKVLSSIIFISDILPYINAISARKTNISLESVTKDEEGITIMLYDTDQKSAKTIKYDEYKALSDEDKKRVVASKDLSDIELTNLIFNFFVMVSCATAGFSCLSRMNTAFSDGVSDIKTSYESKNLSNRDVSKFFQKSLGMLTPSLSILESYNESEVKNGDKLIDFIDANVKKNLGIDSVARSIAGLEGKYTEDEIKTKLFVDKNGVNPVDIDKYVVLYSGKSKLQVSRSEYFNTCLNYIDIVLKGVSYTLVQINKSFNQAS